MTPTDLRLGSRYLVSEGSNMEVDIYGQSLTEESHIFLYLDETLLIVFYTFKLHILP